MRFMNSYGGLIMNNNEILLLKLGEVVLKGLNRRSFEDKLVSNVRRRMKPCGSFQIYIRQSTIYVEPQTEDCDMEAAFKAARQVFGIVTVSYTHLFGCYAYFVPTKENAPGSAEIAPP